MRRRSLVATSITLAVTVPACVFVCILAWPSTALAADAAPRAALDTPFYERVISFLGIAVLLGIGYAWNLVFIKRTKRMNWRPIIWGVALQLIFGLIVLSDAMSQFFVSVDRGVHQLIAFSTEGAKFVFGTLALSPGTDGSFGFFFFFNVLPTIIFFSSLMAILYHLRVMQFFVRIIAIAMQKTMKTSGAETLSASANIFVGQTEAPLMVKPFIEKMTKSELHAVMVGGFATVAGGVMAAYVAFLGHIPNIASHLVIASIMSAPAALAVSKIMYPETEESMTAGDIKMDIERPDANVIEAAARGASDGMTLVLNVAAMLIAFVALIALTNALLGYIDLSGEPLSLERILGWIFMPIAFIMGVPWEEAAVVGRLLGEKLILTEFVAYLNLGSIMDQTPELLSERSALIASYALCGFANFASIGIQIGGIGGIAPSRRGDLARLGLSAMVGGALAACMTGTVAGILL
jgi:CNT family concentrative nucleoside transporter